MDISAILVLSEQPAHPSMPHRRGKSVHTPGSFERLAGRPVASLELLGRSSAQRTIDFLHAVGIENICLALKSNMLDSATTMISKQKELALVDHPVDPWLAGREALANHARDGVRTVLLVRLGAYVEFDLEDLLLFHRDRGRAITFISDKQGLLDFWVLDGTRCGTPEIDLTRFAPNFTGSYRRLKYSNRLMEVGDVRAFIEDVFLSRCSAKPTGLETRPGVWVDDGAEIHRQARIVAPAFIGVKTEIRETALITGFSHVERGCKVDCGTIVDHSSILPDTYLGPWLDVSRAVVSGDTVVHLHHNVTIEINDAKLIGRAAS